MKLDLYVDTSRKGISMAVATDGQGDSARYEEIVNPDARGEILGASVDELLKRLGATLDDVKRVMVTLGPGSFSGLRTGVAFCQGLCFSGKRELYGVTTLQALQCFAGAEFSANKTAVVIRARNGYWYLRGFDHTRGAGRTFRLDRMDAAESVSPELWPADDRTDTRPTNATPADAANADACIRIDDDGLLDLWSRMLRYGLF